LIGDSFLWLIKTNHTRKRSAYAGIFSFAAIVDTNHPKSIKTIRWDFNLLITAGLKLAAHLAGETDIHLTTPKFSRWARDLEDKFSMIIVDSVLENFCGH
jgi:hypothetical protein